VTFNCVDGINGSVLELLLIEFSSLTGTSVTELKTDEEVWLVAFKAVTSLTGTKFRLVAAELLIVVTEEFTEVRLEVTSLTGTNLLVSI
jgi:hypothetical protein